MNNKEIIKELEKLVFTLYPYEKVKDLISKFQPKILRITIPEGQRIERIRPDIDVFERNEVSYRPAFLNTRPQRATLPNKTAFYGTLCHENDASYNSRYIMLLETSKLCQQGISAEGEEQYTLSRWQVVKPLKLAVFVHEDVFAGVSSNPLLSLSRQEWEKSKTFIDDLFQSEDYSKFVASQFAKPVKEDYEYIISATIADMLMYASRLDGVIYPPVKAEGEYGMNVAIRPDVVDDKMILVDVREMTYSQNKGNGHLRFSKTAEPLEMDSHGLKRWKYITI